MEYPLRNIMLHALKNRSNIFIAVFCLFNINYAVGMAITDEQLALHSAEMHSGVAMPPGGGPFRPNVIAINANQSNQTTPLLNLQIPKPPRYQSMPLSSTEKSSPLRIRTKIERKALFMCCLFDEIYYTPCCCSLVNGSDESGSWSPAN